MTLQATREAAEGMHAQAGELVDALRLQLNDDKPAVLDLRKPFEFLGLRFERREQWEAPACQPPQALDELGWRPMRRPACDCN